MQREALICLAVFVTLAVVGPGHDGEPELVIVPAQDTAIISGDSLSSASQQHMIIKSFSAVDSALQQTTGPWQIQFVGTGETATEIITMQLDVAI